MQYLEHFSFFSFCHCIFKALTSVFSFSNSSRLIRPGSPFDNNAFNLTCLVCYQSLLSAASLACSYLTVIERNRSVVLTGSGMSGQKKSF